MRHDRFAISLWDQQHGEHWDSALRGNAPLRAAIGRLLRAEMGTAHGLAVINYVGDIAKLYDNIMLEHVASAAQKLDFPVGPC
eukprot:11205464-Lingulodinium_polyedra.AAC.1